MSLIKKALATVLVFTAVSCQEELTCKNPRSQICTKEYNPVCGWYNNSIQCFAYPCAGEYSNSCSACADEKVSGVTQGPCPKVGSKPEPIPTEPIPTKPVESSETICKDPRPEICTMEYNQVCG